MLAETIQLQSACEDSVISDPLVHKRSECSRSCSGYTERTTQGTRNGRACRSPHFSGKIRVVYQLEGLIDK